MIDPLTILNAVKDGSVNPEQALLSLQESLLSESLSHTVLDLNRESRTGFPEVIFSERKTPQQLLDIVKKMAEKKVKILATRVTDPQFDLLQTHFPNGIFSKEARIFTLSFNKPELRKGVISVLAAGTSDFPVAEECALTAEFYGNHVQRIYDVGVAGLHRLLHRLDEIRQSRVIVVIAGMEGALPSVVGGLVSAPVLAVPTSVGYGSSFNGLTALLGMLNSCSAGIAVFNIDNGFGAGQMASRINFLGEK